MSRTSECVSSSALLRSHALCIRSFARALLSDSRQWMSHVSHVWISHVTCLCSACTRSTSAFSHDLSLDSTKARVITRACRLIHVFLPRLQIPTPYMPTLPLHNYKPYNPYTLCCMPAMPLNTSSMSMRVEGAAAFCQWWDIMCCDIGWRNYCIGIWALKFYWFVESLLE